MFCFDLTKEEQSILKQIFIISRETPGFIDKVIEDKDIYCKGFTSRVLDVITHLEKSREDGLDINDEINSYLEYFALNDKQRRNLSFMLQLCSEDDALKNRIIEKYKQGNCVPEEKFAVERMFNLDLKEQVEQERLKLLERDYSSMDALSDTMCNILVGKIIREKLNVSNGLVKSKEKDRVLKECENYFMTHQKESFAIFDNLLLESMKHLLNGNIEAFDQKIALPNISNISYQELIEYSKSNKMPYQKK